MDRLIVERGETYFTLPTQSFLSVKTLILRDHSTIIISPNVNRYVLKARNVVIGNDVTIASFGENGDNYGEHGGDAASFYLDFGTVDIKGLSIISVGGVGYEGRPGAHGSDGIRARCIKRRYAKPGGDGSDGYAGGNGGNSGQVYFGWSDTVRGEDSLNVSIVTKGGAGGEGGRKGLGGKEASGSGKCGFWPLYYKFGGAPAGNDGRKGPPGKPGRRFDATLYRP